MDTCPGATFVERPWPAVEAKEALPKAARADVAIGERRSFRRDRPGHPSRFDRCRAVGGRRRARSRVPTAAIGLRNVWFCPLPKPAPGRRLWTGTRGRATVGSGPPDLRRPCPTSPYFRGLPRPGLDQSSDGRSERWTGHSARSRISLPENPHDARVWVIPEPGVDPLEDPVPAALPAALQLDVTDSVICFGGPDRNRRHRPLGRITSTRWFLMNQQCWRTSDKNTCSIMFSTYLESLYWPLANAFAEPHGKSTGFIATARLPLLFAEPKPRLIGSSRVAGDA
jgi:hypothetical protein